VDANTGSAPTYQRVLLPQVSPGRYDEVANSQLPYDGSSPLVLTRGRLFLDQGSLAPERAFLFTATQAGSTVNIADRAPIGPLGPGYNEFQLAGVTLQPGEFLGYGIGTDATVGRLYIGGYKAPGLTGISILDSPGNQASEMVTGTMPNYAIALQVFGNPPGSGGGGGGGGASGNDVFSLSLPARTDVEYVFANVSAASQLSASFSGTFRFKDETFELKPKAVELSQGSTTVFLKWKHTAKTVRRITGLLRENAKARKQRAELIADITYADGTADTFTATTKLKP
jgi:hypothetical protein